GMPAPASQKSRRRWGRPWSAVRGPTGPHRPARHRVTVAHAEGPAPGLREAGRGEPPPQQIGRGVRGRIIDFWRGPRMYLARFTAAEVQAGAGAVPRDSLTSCHGLLSDSRSLGSAGRGEPPGVQYL